MTDSATSQSRTFGEWVRFLWYEGSVRHVIIHKDEHQPIDLPLVLVLAAAVFAPWLLAIGIVVAVVKGYAIRIERQAPDEGEEDAWAPLPDEPTGAEVPPAADAADDVAPDADPAGGSGRQPKADDSQ